MIRVSFHLEEDEDGEELGEREDGNDDKNKRETSPLARILKPADIVKRVDKHVGQRGRQPIHNGSHDYTTKERINGKEKFRRWRLPFQTRKSIRYAVRAERRRRSSPV